MSTKTSNLGPFKFTLQILTGVYCGLLIVSFGLCYLLYSDANQRQNIPFELSLDDHINAVMAINKMMYVNHHVMQQNIIEDY